MMFVIIVSAAMAWSSAVAGPGGRTTASEATASYTADWKSHGGGNSASGGRTGPKVTKCQHPWACLNSAGLTCAQKLGCSEWPGIPPHSPTTLARTGVRQWRNQHQQQ